MFDHFSLATVLVSFVALLFALSVHEAAHATAAYLLEDDTARRLGRMTLNPLAHIDPLGTLVMPLLGLLTGWRLLGWAKPVPVDTNRLTRKYTMRVGHAMVAAAGPLSNLLQSLVFLIIVCLFIRFAVPTPAEDRLLVLSATMNAPVEAFLRTPMLNLGSVLVLTLLGRLVIVNVCLAIFNLLPIGPLDGAAILRGILPYKSLAGFDRAQPIITVVMMALFFFGALDKVLGPLIDFAMFVYVSPVARLLLGA